MTESDTARSGPPRVVFPEWDEPRVTQARRRLEAEGVCRPVPPAADADALSTVLVEGRGMKPAIARRMLERPLFRAAAMVAAGRAEAMVAGVATPTRRVIEAAAIGIGMADGVTVPSSCFLMVFPDGREVIFADCAVTVAPGAAELADIARASAATCAALIGPPRVALLSYSTGTSGSGDSVERVRAAAEATGFAGPVQADAALNPEIARRKGIAPTGANVLVFPSLDAGNIAYKLCRELAGAQALGPLLQGFRRPVCDLSRGATVEDIVSSTAMLIEMT